MARLRSYAEFSKACMRLRRLHDVTVHSYHETVERGKDLLRKKENRSARVELRSGTRKVAYPLRELTFHARDVYPALLRSVLLVRLVSAFEVFLVNSVREVANRALDPFMTDRQISLTHEHLLKLASKNQTVEFVLKKILRDLTNGSISDVAKYFQKNFAIALSTDVIPFSQVEEIYDRRHLHVHNGGFVDGIYLHKYPACGLTSGVTARVSEEYFLNALRILDEVALHVKREMETKYPTDPEWKRMKGKVVNLGLIERVMHVEVSLAKSIECGALLDLHRRVGVKNVLADILMWGSTNGREVRMVLGGRRDLVNCELAELSKMHRQGLLTSITRTRVVD